MLASINGTLNDKTINIKDGFAVDVVLSSGGYPDAYEKGVSIKGLEDMESDILVFHAGTKMDGENLVTNGGRVLNVIGLGKDFKLTRKNVYNAIKKIQFDKMHYRKDIGFRAL